MPASSRDNLAQQEMKRFGSVAAGVSSAGIKTSPVIAVNPNFGNWFDILN
jgi:predicted membrane-bound spermidine synthase